MIAYPKIDPWLAREIQKRHPDILIVQHPAWRTWQLYENPEARRGSTAWTAERLHHAIAFFNAKKRASGDWQWWKWPGAPQLIETLPRAPGSWLLRYLAQKDMYRTGGAQAWFRDLEEEEERRKAASRREVSDMHLQTAKDGLYRHARDFVRDDGMAGKRHWVRSPHVKGGV